MVSSLPQKKRNTPSTISSNLLSRMKKAGFFFQNPAFFMRFLTKSLEPVKAQGFSWSCWADLNRRPHPYQKNITSVLPGTHSFLFIPANPCGTRLFLLRHLVLYCLVFPCLLEDCWKFCDAKAFLASSVFPSGVGQSSGGTSLHLPDARHRNTASLKPQATQSEC